VAGENPTAVVTGVDGEQAAVRNKALEVTMNKIDELLEVAKATHNLLAKIYGSDKRFT